MRKIISFISIHTLASVMQPVPAQKLAPTAKDALVTVAVINEKKFPQSGETVTFESIATKKKYAGVTLENGKFDLLVPKGDKYNIKYKSFTADQNYTTMDVPNNKGELLEFEVTVQFELPQKYKLENVYFKTGSTEITPQSFTELNELVEYMKLKKLFVIEIAGHTDNVGDQGANLKLSQDRANSVRSYLIKNGISEKRVIARGYGDTQPVVSNDTDANKQKNRRTEVRIIKE